MKPILTLAGDSHFLITPKAASKIEAVISEAMHDAIQLKREYVSGQGYKFSLAVEDSGYTPDTRTVQWVNDDSDRLPDKNHLAEMAKNCADKVSAG